MGLGSGYGGLVGRCAGYAAEVGRARDGEVKPFVVRFASAFRSAQSEPFRDKGVQDAKKRPVSKVVDAARKGGAERRRIGARRYPNVAR